MKYFPINYDSTNSKCLLIGGGTIAYRKLRILLKGEFNITVISPELCEEISLLIQQTNTAFINSKFKTEYLNDYNMIVSATNDPALNREIATKCLKSNKLVNTVDQPELCNFIFPAIVDRTPATISISSDGFAPTVSRFLRSELEKMIPFTISNLCIEAREQRKESKKLMDSEKKELWERIFNNLRLTSTSLNASPAKKNSSNTIINVSFKDPDTITIKDYRTLQNASILLHPSNTPNELVEYFRRESEQYTYNNSKQLKQLTQTYSDAIILINSDN